MGDGGSVPAAHFKCGQTNGSDRGMEALESKVDLGGGGAGGGGRGKRGVSVVHPCVTR